MRIQGLLLGASLAVVVGIATHGAAAEWGLKEGTPELESAGPLSFGPDGILIVGDTKAAVVYAIATGDTSGDPSQVKLNIADINAQVGKTVGAASVTINDLAVNPISGNVYLSVAKQDGEPAIVRIDGSGKLSEISLKKVAFGKVSLPNPPEDKEVGDGRRRGNYRSQSITDIAYVDGKVIVSGMSNGTASSTIREIAFPFHEADQGTNVEIYHGAHGRFEDTAVARTLVPFTIDGEPTVLAGFTCTPLVKFPLTSLTPGEKVRGTTVAELGNRNQPLDMIVYERDGKRFLLLANSARGVMKISTENIGRDEGISEPVRGGGVAGQTYETISSLQGVIQLDKLNDQNAIVLAQADSGTISLQTVALP